MSIIIDQLGRIQILAGKPRVICAGATRSPTVERMILNGYQRASISIKILFRRI